MGIERDTRIAIYTEFLHLMEKAGGLLPEDMERIQKKRGLSVPTLQAARLVSWTPKAACSRALPAFRDLRFQGAQ